MESTREWCLGHKALWDKIALDGLLEERIIQAHAVIKEAFATGRKALIMGNGGSAEQAKHFAAELVCRFEKERRAVAAIALTTDGSILTAQSNDHGFETVFERQIEALCQAGDVVIALTTSDAHENSLHSQNILRGLKKAKLLKAWTIGLFSQKTKHLLLWTDIPIMAPSTNTALIQEAHLAVIHRLCKWIEEGL